MDSKIHTPPRRLPLVTARLVDYLWRSVPIFSLCGVLNGNGISWLDVSMATVDNTRMADKHEKQAEGGKGSLFRQIGIFPAALIGNSIVVFVLTRLARTFAPPLGASPAVTMGIAQAAGLFFGGASFVASGVITAPTRKRKVAWNLFCVHLALILVIEMFLPPLKYALPHLVRLPIAVFGELCGLLSVLWLSRRKPTGNTAATSLSEPQNPWSSV